MRDFDGSQVLFRLGFASWMRAAARQRQSVERDGDPERSARFFDAKTEAVVLMQASAEAWVHRQFDQHLPTSSQRAWPSRWR